ncbi:hypothetical protein BU24DRAFT_450757 [Aaosphaeria arxii CBS 175.79]|uniref:SH3 domain-containing protein n=1 Tax=Aaosphaeria arxii CBS 175.79 TaxID=1450172 RepID=A0A6A5XV93_9PLEO|nr:uncharacterized protein BU24DRAFT_450757 [Aaosphaeria arxii CBS 175.79]KAF2016174.1 hypothetical protein BU24DRAFT_450757 [Aaosphaeria arxii CBS 175.79]
MPGMAATEPPSVTLSFANNFWGKDDAGVGPMLDRLHNAKVTSDELRSFYAARGAIEEEYARKLLNLSRKSLGSSESGTLRLSLDIVKQEVEAMGKAHQSIAQQMKTELEEPLTAFAGGMRERRKIVQNGIEKLLKIKMQQTSAVNKSRDRYEQDCLKIKGFLAQAHMVMGHEERKNKARLEKTQIQLSTTSNEYEAAVKVLEETTGRWNRDWKAACDKFQDLEEERLDYTKSSLWTFANIASTVCVSDDASCEKIRLSLEDCEVEKDIMAFIQDNGTGQEIPDPPKFINFCRGDTDTASEPSEDGNYSVAQFQRTMNPAYRASSPQPSMFESHHDPNNPLAKEMGLGGSQPIPQDQIDMQPRRNPQTVPQDRIESQPRRNTQSVPQDHIDVQPRRHTQPEPDQRVTTMQNAAPAQHAPMTQQPPAQSMAPVQSPQSTYPLRIQPDPRLVQAQQQARQNYQQSQVPHNDYPMDGMTQYCRIGPPSERSSIPSPVRPSSRDSQSDYSNPTSLSSIEPPSGSASPGKPMAPIAPISPLSPISPAPQPLEEKQEVKKKTNFFQNHSPFRRKSKHDIQPPPALATPNSRNTWAPTSKRVSNEDASPTRQYGRDNRGAVLGGAPSASPEPVDPRANFQLNIGNNVFDVASPDARKKEIAKDDEPEDLDPIAQALAELKGVTKDASLRVSADRYHGLATPQPPGTPAAGAKTSTSTPTPLTSAALNTVARATPPPSYEQPPISRLGAPKPAHTARAMQQTTQSYVSQKANMFNGGTVASRQSARTTTQQAPSRAVSPAPLRAKSPQPGQYQAQPASPAEYRSTSPNPYAASNVGGRQRSHTTTSPVKPNYGAPTGRGSYSSTRGESPSYAPSQRAVSPQPQAQPQPKPQIQPQVRPQSQAQPRPQSQAQPRPQSQAQPRPQPQAQPRTQPQATQPRPQPQAAQPRAQPQATQPRPQFQAQPRAQAPSQSQPQPQPQTQPQSRPQPQSQPQPQASQSYASTRPGSRMTTGPPSRAVSPNPSFRQSHDRPGSSRGSDMAIQLSPGPGSERGEGSVYGGSQRGRPGTSHSVRPGTSQSVRPGTSQTRPMSSYYGGGGSDLGYGGSGGGEAQNGSRARSKSLAEPRQYTRDGRMILHYSRAMYMYAAQIPEELSFAKGDILAVLRLQDDGWWEAEVVGKNSRPGLVPSNYLQNC